MNSYNILLPICSYTGGIILMSIQNNDKGFYIYSTIIVLVSAVFMAKNIWKLPAKIRLKNAILELGYCILSYSLMIILTPILGNIITGILIIVVCLIYIKNKCLVIE